MLFSKKQLNFFIFSFFVFLFFIPLASLAQKIPETNPLCWNKDACKGAIEGNEWTWDPKKNFFLSGPDGICGNKMGVCIPAGQTDAEITIGGKVKFTDLGDYIKTVYVWLMGIGGLVAAIMIIIGGFMYMTSAGSSDRVKSAKERIGSALLGLVLLLGSYTLLYTINPDLVRLRLPKVYMLRTVILGTAEYCKELPFGTLVGFAGDKKSSSQLPSEAFKVVSNPDLNDPTKIQGWFAMGVIPACGFKFFWKDSNDQTCFGHLCQPAADGTPKVCVKEVKDKYICKEGNIFGTITSSDIPFPFIDNNLRLIGICEDGKNFPLNALDVTDGADKKSQSYIFKFSGQTLLSKIKTACGSDKARGFYFGAEVNDESGLVGGCDDWMAVGQRNGKCDINLSKLILPTAGGINWSCSSIGFKTDSGKNSLSVPVEYLISQNELMTGTVCNIILTREEFPSIKNKAPYTPICALVDDPTRCQKHW